MQKGGRWKKEKRRVWKKRNRLDGSWSAAARGGSFAQCSGSNFGKPDIDRNAIVIQSGRLQDNGRRAQQDGRREDPQEESIQNHGHVLPILADLRPTAEKREKPHQTTSRMTKSLLVVPEAKKRELFWFRKDHEILHQ